MATTEIRYIGPSTTGVDIAETGQHAPRLKPIEVESHLAKALLDQDVFELVEEEKPAKAEKDGK
jgi:hypothetical protein